MTKPLSPDNAALLQWKLGRPMTPGLKVTLTAENLGALLDAARADEQANILCRQIDAAVSVVKEAGEREQTRAAVAEAAGQAKH